MSDWVTLYSGGDTSAESLCQYLSERSVAVHKQVKWRPVASRRRGSRQVVVQVPAGQLDAAMALYQEWRLPHDARAREASGRMLKIVLLSLVAPAAWIAVYFAGVAEVPFPEPAWLVGLWMLTLVVLAQIDARRRRSETTGGAA